ncbi:MAG: hypothetical protein JXA33_10675 [Anaerolineae bacterium]|nr:hypothetical protein [Anaerolineae bacterium]
MVILILISAAFVGVVFVIRHSENNNRWLSWGGFLGSVLALLAFFLLPWVELGGISAFQQNIEWIVANFNTLDSLLIQLSLSPTSVSPETLCSIFDDRTTYAFLSLVQKGNDFHAWQLMQAAFRVQPPLVMALGLSLLIALASGLVDVWRLMTGNWQWGSRIRKYLPLCSIVVILLLLGYFPLLDSLGAPDNLKVRLLAALASAKVGCGLCWMVVGMIAAILGSIRDWLPSVVLDVVEEP